MSHLKGTRRKCVQCDKEVEITEVIPEGDDFRQILSCGHTPKYVERTREERISITEQLSASKTIKIQPLINSPVLVSGDSGIKANGLLPTFYINNLHGNLIVDPNTISNFLSSYETTVDNSTNIDNSTNVDLHDIFIDIDNSSNSIEDKDLIKELLNILNRDIKSKPLPQIGSSLSDKIKTCIPLATPFIVPFLTKVLTQT